MTLKSRFHAFLDGVASVLDLSGTYFIHHGYRRQRRSDAEALARDWERVGQDFNYVIEEVIGHQASGIGEDEEERP